MRITKFKPAPETEIHITTYKERLVELVGEADRLCGKSLCFDCVRTVTNGGCFPELVANHLIANGVVVQNCGHWVKLPNGRTCCNVCLGNAHVDKNKFPIESDFCPHCGAKLKAKDEE